MTRRPPGPGVNPRPAARMAPGGRMWSESPVRRPYPRVRQVGAAVTSVPIPEGSFTSGALEDNWTQEFPTTQILLNQSWSAKTDVIVIGFGNMATFATPTVLSHPEVTFTTVGSGTDGNHRWHVWRAANVALSGTVGVELIVTGGTTESVALAWSFAWDGGNAVPLNVAADWVTGTSVTWPAIPGGDTDGWYSPWQTIVGAPPSGTGGAGGYGEVWFPNAGAATPNWLGAQNWGSPSGPGWTRIYGTSSLVLQTGSISEGNGQTGKWLRLVCGWGST